MFHLLLFNNFPLILNKIQALAFEVNIST
jgi:hypothetical protein